MNQSCMPDGIRRILKTAAFHEVINAYDIYCLGDLHGLDFAGLVDHIVEIAAAKREAEVGQYGYEVVSKAAEAWRMAQR